MPVVAKGDRYVFARELTAIDRLFGWVSADRDLLPPGELAARMAIFLEASIRFARQLPSERYDDVIPGQQGANGPLVLPDGSALRRADGTPYMPHHTYIGLVRHIVGHGGKFMHLATDPESDVYRETRTFTPLGEPPGDTTMDALIQQLAMTIEDIRRWWSDTSGRDAERIVQAQQGPRTLHQMLDSMLYATAQHTRQLESLIRLVGIQPDRPLSAADLNNLSLPGTIWG